MKNRQHMAVGEMFVWISEEGQNQGWAHENKKGMITKGCRAWLWKREGGGMEGVKEQISFFFSAVQSCCALIFTLTDMQLRHANA